MPTPSRPPARRRAARRCLDLLLVAGLLGWTADQALQAAARAPGRPAPPARVTVDLLADPAWRLLLLPGIGRARAYALVGHRAHIRTWADVARVPGIGPRLVRRLRAADSPVRACLRGARAPP